MNRKGYVLLDIMVGIFLIGLIATTCFPMITSSFNNYNRIKDRAEMIYICEMIIEKLKSDISLAEDIINKLESLNYTEFFDESIDNNYDCKIYKLKSTDRLMDLKVNVSSKNQVSNYEVEFKASIPKQ